MWLWKRRPEIPYEKGAHYVFDRGYNDFGNLYTIHRIEAFFVVRAKTNVRFKPETWKRRLPEKVVSDSVGHLTVYKSSKDYPEKIRKVVCVDPEDGTKYIFLTNNLTAPAETIADLYRHRWSVELFFKWIKQHLRIKRFWGTSENAVRIQIYCAIITYCLVAIVKHDMTSQTVQQPVSQKVTMSKSSASSKSKPQSKSVAIPPLPDGFMGARIAAHDLDRYRKGEAICAYICKPDEIVGKHHWIWYDFNTGQPRCELTPPPSDRYIPDAFNQQQSSDTASVSQSNGIGITISSPSFSGTPIPDEGFAHSNGISDVIGSAASPGEEFKLWLSRHPGMTIDEALHRYREEQKAKKRRQGPKLH